MAQPRITFVLTPEEIAEVALFHMDNVKEPVVSFGQGCEGEPLLAGKVLEKSIKLIRSETSKGMINVNTNASRPRMMGRLFDAGLDSMRVSLNSTRSDYYTRYFKPMAYTFKDLMQSIKITKEKRGFVSVNYLTMPGFTDSKDEIEASKYFIETYRIDMIQWRNLNLDPLHYFRQLKVAVGAYEMFGISKLINSPRKSFPKVI